MVTVLASDGNGQPPSKCSDDIKKYMYDSQRRLSCNVSF